MVVVFATVGFHPEAIKPAIKHLANIKKCVFFCGSTPEEDSRKRLAQTKEHLETACKMMDIPTEFIDLPDEADFCDIFRKIRSKLREEGGKDVAKNCVFNITGGTKPMSLAAVMACVHEGVDAYYYTIDEDQPVKIPLLRVKYADNITEKQKEILTFIGNTPSNETCCASDIAKKMRLSPATVSTHLDRLENVGGIERTPNKKNRSSDIIKITDAAKLMLEDEIQGQNKQESKNRL